MPEPQIARLGLIVDANGAVQPIRATTEQLKTLANGGREAQAVLKGLTGGMTQAGAQAQAVARQTASLTGSIQSLPTGLTRATTAAESHRLTLGRLGNQFESLVSQIAGVPPVFGKLTSVLGDFAVGSVVMTGVLGGLALLAAAWDRITKSSREAHKAQDDAIKDLAERFRPETGKGSLTNDEYDLALQRQREDVQKLTILRNSRNDFSVAAGYRAAGFQAPLQNRDNELTSVLKDLADTNRVIARTRMHGAGVLATVSVTGDSLSKQRSDADRLAAQRDRERSEKFLLDAGAEQRRREDLTAARQMKLVPDSAVKPITGELDDFQKRLGALLQPMDADREATLRHAETMKHTKDEIAVNLQSFKSLTGALDMLKEGALSAADTLLNEIKNAFGNGILGGVIHTIEGGIRSVVDKTSEGIRHAIFGSTSEQRAAAAAARDAQRSIKLTLDSLRAGLTGDTLTQQIDAARQALIGLLASINQALPGTKNEAERNRQRAEAETLERQQEALLQHQDTLRRQYDQEDLQVRNLRATGHGDEADLLSFKNQQAREMQAAIDANKDATYLSYLATVQNNELVAYQNGLLEDAVRNAPSGFFVNSYLSQFADRTPPDPFGTGLIPPNYPTEPPHTGSGGTSGLTPPGGQNPPAPHTHAPTNATFNFSGATFQFNGNKSGDEMLKDFADALERRAATTGGPNTSLSEALDTLR